jgi:NAD-dependent SIR2 family protein deacetylase
MSGELDKEMFFVSCVNCNNQIFQFSKNMLESDRQVILQCPKCKENTKVSYDSISGVAIGKY